MDKLSIWHNEENYVIAYSEEDAIDILSEEQGYSSIEEYKNDYPEEVWKVWPSDKPLLIAFDQDDEDSSPDEEYKLPEYWIEKRGRGLLASSDY